MNINSLKQPGYAAAVAVTAVALASTPAAAAPNNAPSYTPGPSQSSSACDGEVVTTGWAQNVTDGDGEVSGLRFLMTGTSNADMFLKLPFVSWPSKTLSYQLKPGTPGGIVSTVSAVLIDTSGTGQGGQDTSEEQSWTITTVACTDVDLDGIADEIDPEIAVLADTDGDGIVDLLDDDDDNDGILDIDEGAGLVDTDGDGLPDSIDTDSDNDNIPDADETGDSDGDGILDSQEPDNGVDVTTDTDGDGITDDIDTDDDGDGISDADEGNGEIDSDNDGIPESLDLDSDNDGIGDDGNPIADEPVVTPESGDAVIETGINGGGCTLGAGGPMDPLLVLTALAALLGLRRRRS